MTRRTRSAAEPGETSQTAEILLAGETLTSRIIDALEANGELPPAERLADDEILESFLGELKELWGAEEDLVARLAAVIRAGEGRLATIETTIRRFDRRKARTEAMIARCKGAAHRILVSRDERGLGDRIEYPEGAVRLQRSGTPAVIGPVDLDAWEAVGLIKIRREPDRLGARHAIEAGEELPGFSLEYSRSLRLP